MAAQDTSLRGVSQAVLRSYPGIEGGYNDGAHFLGYSYPTHDTGGKINNGADSWSPDGRKIAFASNRAGTPQVFVMNADGSGVTQLTHGSESHFAAWGTHH